ncbi:MULTISPECIES: 2-dehydropantoate 2-reductase [unclassified Bacillus (in: firmicutes)]|uniref:2-dehydropantoate 2-reductase n=1 Tax=unclassified Bacillus (in: firmicutes) TaxID=185979 RepID=UPI0008DF75C3|nr:MULTISPECIES: 2-dehydropantoate 2-reductase [unclassified Bacillus (in: firmicutes)]SFA75630.1 2-dehydropantoate 2-reductase [Bacillus sp. UNCCL13]SFQ65711.1 2-dehydropantoate 2-reductase [Bacillus sp. cl95]
MRIGIIGAGSIGLLFAAYLSDTYEVTVYTRSDRQSEDIRSKGLALKESDECFSKEVNVAPIHMWSGNEELTIITVKQHQLPKVINTINSVGAKSLLFLQNGMGHIKFLKDAIADNIFLGSVEHGAYKENGHSVQHNGKALTRVAVYRGDESLLRSFVKGAPSNFPFVVEADYFQMLQAKLVINAVINPLTAVLRVENGLLVENPYYYKLLKELYSEIANILNLNEEDGCLEKIVSICKNTAQNRSSMLKDLEAARKTEVEAILGYLIDMAKENDVKASLVRGLYFAVKGMESMEEEGLPWEG